jgi:hypothetical protein
VPAGRVDNTSYFAFWDLMPTFGDIAGRKRKENKQKREEEKKREEKKQEEESWRNLKRLFSRGGLGKCPPAEWTTLPISLFGI